MNTKTKRRFTANEKVGLILAFAFFGYLFLLSLYYFKRGIETYFWIRTPAVVEDTSIGVSSSGGPRGGRGFSYIPIVDYSYTLNGKTHSNNNITYSVEIWPFENEAKEIIAGYSIDQKIYVYYSKSSPWKSSIHRGMQFRAVIFCSLVSIFSGTFLFLTVRYIIRKKAFESVACVRSVGKRAGRVCNE